MRILIVILVSAYTVSAADKPKSIEAKTKIHRLAGTHRSAFDAFVYINRIPDKPEDGELPEDFAGRIYGRLANQEGRILLKLPPTMDRKAYFGFKTFLGSEGDVNVANCVSCHSPAGFTDGKSHVVESDRSPMPTPSLRNLKLNQADLEKMIRAKMAASQAKKTGKAKDISPAYARMDLTERDVSNLVAFLKTLRDVDDNKFRELIIKAKVFDATQPPSE